MLVVVLLWDNNRIIYINNIFLQKLIVPSKGRIPGKRVFLGGILLEKTGLGIFLGRQVSLKVRYLIQH